jgi:hypothetical protein
MQNPVVTYSTAKGYVQSAFLMMTNPFRYQAADDTSFYLAFHMLCGFATELYLKAFLAHKGHDKDLKGLQLRHNLKNLHVKATSYGFSDEGAKLLVDHLGDHHASFEFRYMQPTSVYKVIPLATMFHAFSTLDVLVDTAVGASASKGRDPEGAWSFPPNMEWRVPR